MDFAHLQVWAHRVMQDDGVAAAARADVRHLMVDEFQDTSRVQMRMLESLAESTATSLWWATTISPIYRFRGASVANLLEFPQRFQGCRVAKLTTNYRCHRDIVAAAGRWMNSAAQWKSDDISFRYAKDIVPNAPDFHPDYPAVISVHGQDSTEQAAQLTELLRFLKDHGVMAGYGQVALLLHSVKDSVSRPIPGRRKRPACRSAANPPAIYTRTQTTRCWSPPSTRPRGRSGTW